MAFFKSTFEMKCFTTILLFKTDTYILKSKYVNSLVYSNDIPPMSGELIGQFHDVHWDLWCEMDFSLYPVDKHVSKIFENIPSQLLASI